MKVLALDLATVTGFAFGDSFDTAHCGVLTLPGFGEKQSGLSFGGAYSAIRAMCAANGIQAVVIEEVLTGISKKNKRDVWTPTSRQGDRALLMLSGAARAAVSNAGINDVRFPAPQTWRKSVLGEGFPKDPKAAAIKYCRRMGRDIADHNAAEAMCMLQFGLSQANLLDRIKG